MKKFKRIFASRAIFAAVVLCLLFVGATALLGAEKVKTEKKSDKGYLGVSIENLSHQEKKDLGISHGVQVTHVVAGEAADKAGIKEDDIIQFFNDEKIRSTGDLVDAVRAAKPETSARVKLVRDGKPKEITVTVGRLETKLGKLRGRDLFFTRKGGYLGIHLQELNKDLAEYFGVKPDEGALVLRVEKESPAEEAGLKAGDVIVEVDGDDVAAPGDVSGILSELKKGDKIEIKIVRHKKKMAVKAELGEGHGFRYFNIFKGSKDASRLIPGFDFDKFIYRDTDSSRIYWYDDARKRAEKELQESLETQRKKQKEIKESSYI